MYLSSLFLVVILSSYGTEGFKIRAANFPKEDIFSAIAKDKKAISVNIRNLEKFRSIRAKNKELRRVGFKWGLTGVV